jgi:hypothetical protein
MYEFFIIYLLPCGKHRPRIQIMPPHGNLTMDIEISIIQPHATNWQPKHKH